MIFFPITLKLLCLISQVHKIWVGILLNFFVLVAVLINIGANLSAPFPIVICSAMLYTRIFLCLMFWSLIFSYFCFTYNAALNKIFKYLFYDNIQ